MKPWVFYLFWFWGGWVGGWVGGRGEGEAYYISRMKRQKMTWRRRVGGWVGEWVGGTYQVDLQGSQAVFDKVAAKGQDRDEEEEAELPGPA